VRFSVFLIVLLLILALPSNVSADELPQAPATPAMVSAPSLPPVQAFGTPNPPGISAIMYAPDIDFWLEKTLSWPVYGNITSGYGPRSNGESERMHNGIDIPVPNGTPVQAAATGIVAEARMYRGYGYTVIIDHVDKTQTLYAHCSDLAVKKGDRVLRGQVIAYAGDTGRASTSHVHFGVMVGGAFKNPVTYLKDKPQQFASKHHN
jgi:murein DD-endopeptidase MepM/ murein hydrolase activator NlpD